MTSKAIEQDRLFVVTWQYFRTSPCPITGTAEYEATRGSTSGWSWHKEKRGVWDEERPSRCGIMLNKPTWKDVRHFESILESLCSLRIFYVYLLRATRTTSPLPPYNPTPSPLFLPTSAFGLSFSSRPILPPRLQELSLASLSPHAPSLSHFPPSSSQRRLHPRRWKLFTRYSEHAPPSRPRSQPSPPTFRSGLPFATLTRCPRLIALVLALIGHAAFTGQGRVASANPASSFSRWGMEKSPTLPWGPPSCALPAATGKHRPISRRFS